MLEKSNAEKVDWEVLPDDEKAIVDVRERCRRLVRRRAAISAGVSAVPIPGVDILSDLSMFKRLVDEVNKEFGLTPEQVDRLQPRHKKLAYEVALGMGGMMVGKFVTRQLLLQVLKRSGLKLFAKSATRFVPIAGQLASAAIGFTVFRKLGYEHVEACTRVAQELAAARATA